MRNSGVTFSKAEIILRVSSVLNMPELHNKIDIYLKKYFPRIVAEPKYSSFKVLYLNYLKIGLDHCCARPFNCIILSFVYIAVIKVVAIRPSSHAT